MELVIRCSVCGLKMIIEEIASSKTHAAVVMHVSPCPCSSRPTKRAADGANAVSQNGIYSDNPNDDEGDK